MKDIHHLTFDFNSESNVSIRQFLFKLKDEFASSSIVALGENSHFIKEFFAFRHHIIEFLVTECNYDTLAFEFGFSEGLEIDKWIKSKLPIDDLDKLTSHFYYPKEFKSTLFWLRNYNEKSEKQVTFLGVDIPKNGGSYFPTYTLVEDFLRKNFIVSSDVLNRISVLVEKLDYYSTAELALNLSYIDVVEQNELKSLLFTVYVRLINLEPKLEKSDFEFIRHQIKGLIYMNYNADAMRSFIGGKGIEGDLGAKDQFMKESIDYFFENSLGKKIILVAHNAHIQKTAVDFDGFISCYPMGQRLAMSYGQKYKAFALTNLSGETAALHADNDLRYGFKVDKYPLDAPESDSIEFLMRKSGIKEGCLLMSELSEQYNCKKIRFDSIYLNTEIKEAFDGVILLEKSTISEVVLTCSTKSSVTKLTANCLLLKTLLRVSLFLFPVRTVENIT